MEIVSDSELQRMCANRLEYDRAEELYYDDRVYSMTMTKVSGASVEFKADIEEYDDTELTASVEIEQTGSGFRIRDYACSCRESRNLLKMCRHAAAVVKEIDFYVDVDEIVEVLSQPIGAAREVLEPYEVEENDSYEKDPVKHLQYLQQMVDKQMKSTFGDSSYGITTGSGKTFGALPASEEKRTTPVLQKVMNELLEEERDQFGIVVEGQQDIRLELTLHLGQNEPEIALRIGRRQLYVVRNIREFVYAVRERSFVRYGKNLEFIHMKHAFRPDAWQLLDFLLDYPFDTQSLNYYGYYTQESKRRLELESKQLDELIPVMEQLDDVYVSEYNDGERKPLYVRHEDPVLPVKIISTDNGNAAQLIFPERVFVLQGVWQLYVYWDGSLYVCTDDYAHKMKKILSLMSGHGSYELNSFRSMSGRTDVLEVRRQDYSMFCATMLPVMKKYMNVSLEHVEFERYLPEPASFEVYLDIAPDNSVVCRAWVSYGDRKHNIWNPASYKDVYRDMRAEYELRSLLGQYFPNISEDSENCYLTEDDDRLAVLVEEGVGQIEQLADVYVSDDFKKIRIAQRVQIVTGVSVKGNLLQVSWNVDNMTAEELEQVLQSYRHKRKYHRLKSGELLSLQQSGLEFLADMQEDLQLGSTQIKKGMAEVPMYRALYLEKLMKDNTDRLRIIRSRRFEELMEHFEQLRDTTVPLPEQLHAQLREYQREGYQWACMLAEMGLGGILADDMGLGKTLQMIACLAHAAGKTHLVVCPASLVYNWESEFRRFAPSLRIGLAVGTAAQRRECIEAYRSYDVVITSYDLLKRDVDLYQGKQFEYEVIDEAQYIKNPSTQAAKAVKTINSRNRFALTGTPIENRLSELWSIFEYLMPGYLYSYKSFKERFEEKILDGNEAEEQKALDGLLRMVQPFILRRLKQDVLEELPDKLEKVVYARFDREQEKLYRAVEKNIVMSLRKDSEQQYRQNKLQILAELTKLRQICCDPSLLYENYSRGSAKLAVCLEYIRNAIAGGHRILLFSQFTTMLDIIEQNLEKENIRSLKLTGATSKLKRRELVDRFQQNHAEVFLISLKAGGTGLNLTAADIVIHYDPWWNVAAQNQATDRAHRIGQENKVTVIRLIAADTIEERIVKLQEKKKELADKVITGEGMSMASLGRDELLELFEVDNS